MEYLQYSQAYSEDVVSSEVGFKPYYKWNTFNTIEDRIVVQRYNYSFKPCYKWTAFST